MYNKFKKLIIESIWELLKSGIKKIIFFFIIIFLVGISLIRNYLYDILFYEVRLFYIITPLIAIPLVWHLYSHIYPKKMYDITCFGCLWKIKVKRNKFDSVVGLSCPKCMTDISHSFKKYSNISVLTCPKCQQRIEIKSTSIEMLKKDVEVCIKSDLNKNKVLDFQFIFENINDVKLWIENISFFDIQDLKISVYLDIKGTNKHLLDDSLDSIKPKSKQQIGDKELNDKLRKELENTGFIKIHYLSCPDILDNGYCEEIIDVGEYHLSLKEEFDTTLTITTKYSIINKKKCMDAKYLIQFRKHALDGSTERYPNDDCLISVNKTK